VSSFQTLTLSEPDVPPPQPFLLKEEDLSPRPDPNSPPSPLRDEPTLPRAYDYRCPDCTAGWSRWRFEDSVIGLHLETEYVLTFCRANCPQPRYCRPDAHTNIETMLSALPKSLQINVLKAYETRPVWAYLTQ